MSADKWVAVPRGLTQGMADNVPVGPDRLPLTEAYEFMLAARPTGPDVPVLVDRAEWEAMQTRVRELEERARKLMSKLGQLRKRDLDAIAAGGVFAGMTPNHLKQARIQLAREVAGLEREEVTHIRALGKGS